MLVGSLIAAGVLSLSAATEATSAPQDSGVILRNAGSSIILRNAGSSVILRSGATKDRSLGAAVDCLEPKAILRFAQDDSPCTDTLPRRRARAVEYSDWYYRRLQVHRWGSWIELPVFAGEYWLGNKLISHTEAPASWVKPTHSTVAGVLGGLFAVNTVTGVWNLYDSRHDTDQRALVWSHSALMLAADAGFAVTGLIAGDAGHSTSGADRHRNVALTSIGLATAGTLLMWVKRGL